MRKYIVVLLVLLTFACKKNETPTDDTLTAVDTSTSAVSTDSADTQTTTTATSDTSATTASETAAAPPTTTQPAASTSTTEPFDFGQPPTEKSRQKYEYLVDTLYDWSTDTQRVVVSRVGYGSHFFTLENRQKLERWRNGQGYEKVRSFEVPAASSKVPNPFINAKRVVIVYRKPR